MGGRPSGVMRRAGRNVGTAGCDSRGAGCVAKRAGSAVCGYRLDPASSTTQERHLSNAPKDEDEGWGLVGGEAMYIACMYVCRAGLLCKWIAADVLPTSGGEHEEVRAYYVGGRRCLGLLEEVVVVVASK